MDSVSALGDTLHRVAERIARDEGVRVSDILGPSRERQPTRARHRLWAVTRASTDLSYPQLGRIFGRDHTTIMSGVRKYEAALQRKGRARCG